MTDVDTTVSDVLEELDEIRRRGYAIDDEEHAIGVRCVAAPVFAAGGEGVAIDTDYLYALGPDALPALRQGMPGAGDPSGGAHQRQ